MFLILVFYADTSGGVKSPTIPIPRNNSLSYELEMLSNDGDDADSEIYDGNLSHASVAQTDDECPNDMSVTSSIMKFDKDFKVKFLFLMCFQLFLITLVL